MTKRGMAGWAVSYPSTDAAYFPSTPAEAFWSSSTVAGSPPSGWFLHFDYGTAYNDAVPSPRIPAGCAASADRSLVVP